MIKLFNDKDECCGCGVCALSCPKQAITMRTTAEGFVYPEVENKKCVDCGLCVKQCPHGKSILNEPINCCAGSNRVHEQKIHSTSAGIFAAVATAFLEAGGLVCGASMTIKNGRAEVKHIMISSVNDLHKLQGSKYVKSDISEVIQKMDVALKDENKILFSGTPCQVAGIKSVYKKYADKLYTMDIVCHGVPSLKFFNDYLEYLQENEKKQVTDVCFRDKKQGWGHKGTVTFEENYKRNISRQNSSYYNFFFECEILRDSCYKCPYACTDRIGDLSIGDYWGAQKFNPELMIQNGGPFVSLEGISCILENTVSGTKLLELTKNRIEIRKIDIENVMVINTQLRTPAKYTSKRQQIFKAYIAEGYIGVEKQYRNWTRKKALVHTIKGLIPNKLKKQIKKAILG